MNSYIKLIELNGQRKFVPEIIDWVEDVDTDTTPEDVRDEFMQFVEENTGLIATDSEGHYHMVCQACVGADESVVYESMVFEVRG